LNGIWNGGEARDFCVVVYELLQNLLNIFQRNEGKWGQIRSSSEFDQFEKSTSELSSVQLYSGYDPLLSFWINLFNLVVLHIHVSFIYLFYLFIFLLFGLFNICFN
jgi:hypothetical protein